MALFRILPCSAADFTSSIKRFSSRTKLLGIVHCENLNLLVT